MSERQVYPINVIVVHAKPHIDECLAIAMLMYWGEAYFPGIAKAEIITEESAATTFNKGDWEQLLKDGYLLLGIGGGMFDEHPVYGRRSRGNECTATLVAAYLGLEDDKALARVVGFVKRVDGTASAHPYDISSVLKAVNEDYEAKEAVRWAVMALLSKYRQEVRYQEAHSVLENAISDEITLPKGETLKIVTATTDNTEFHRLAKNKHNRAAVVIQKNSKGNVQILTNNRFALDMSDVVRTLRLTEYEAKKDGPENAQTPVWGVLEREGTIEEVPEWHYHKEAENILNGSLGHPGINASAIPLDTIRKIVLNVLDPNVFQKDHQDKCRQGVCTASQDGCSWYALGLRRCRALHGR